MNLKTMSLGAIATTAVAGAMFTGAPAQAAVLTPPGGFGLSIDTNITNVTSPAPSSPLTLNVTFTGPNGAPIQIINPNGGFSTLAGTPTIASLTLTRTGSLVVPLPGGGNLVQDLFTTGPVANFITGLRLPGPAGDPVSFDLGASVFVGRFTDSTSYNLTANLIAGIFRSTNAVYGEGFLSAVRFSAGGPGDASSLGAVMTTPVPTPALLPGLLALGAGMLRKRKAEAAEEAAEA